MRNQILRKKIGELGRKAAIVAICLFVIGSLRPSAAQAYQALPLYGDGFLHADKAYSLFAQGRFKETKQELQLALNYYPDHPRLLLLAAQTMEQEGNYEDALRQLAVVNEKYPDFAQALAIRAYIYAKMARHSDAVVYFKRTLESLDDENVDRQGVRINLMDSALRSGQPATAADYLQPQDSSSLRLQIAKSLIDASLYQEALRILDRSAITNLAPVQAAEILFLRGSVLEKLGNDSEALSTYTEVLSLISQGDSPYLRSEVFWKFAETAERKGNVAKALEYGNESVAAWPDSTARRLQFAYLAKRHHQEALAAEQMEKAVQLSKGPVPVAVLRDLAYTLKNLGKNAKAMKYFEQSIDAAEKPESLPVEERRKAIELNYDLRREHETLERKWTVYSAVTYWKPSGGDALVQASVEFDWQIYNNNGRKLALFNRYYGNVWSQSPNSPGPFAWSPVIVSYGWETTQGGVGINWKPLTNANLVLSIENQFPVGRQGDQGWLYRVGYSWDQGYEFKPYVKSWSYRTFYGEYDYWTNNKRNSFGIETRWGRSTRLGGLSSRSVFTPHIFFTANYDSGYAAYDQSNWAMAAGPGFVYRKWYREDKYNAPRSYWDFIVQYRFRLGSRRIDGLLAQWFTSF